VKSSQAFGGAVTALTGMFGRAANQVIALLVTLLAARWLTPVAFGEFAIASALAMLSRALLYAGAFEYLLKAPKDEDANTECLVVNLALALGMTALLALTSLIATPLFRAPDLSWLILALAPSSLLSAAANWQESQLLKSGRLRTYYAVTTIAEIAAAIVTVGLIVAGFGLGALVVQIYTRLSSLVVTYRVFQRPTWSRVFSFDKAWRIARWSSARFGATIINFLSNYSADILLGIFLSPGATGLYRASHRMVTGVSDLINNPTRITSMTVFSRQAAHGADSGHLWPRIAAATALLGWTGLAGLAAISSQGVSLVLGPRWAGAGPVVAILCLQRACALIDGVTIPMLVAYSHVRIVLTVQIASAIGGLILLILMAPYGVVATAIASVIAAVASSGLLIILAARRFSGMLAGLPRVALVALVPAILTGASAWAAGRALGGGHPAILRMAVEVGAGALAFSVSVFALRRQALEVLHALNQPRSVGAAAGLGGAAPALAAG
jgi:O-antigen/teichoic acid export membrane protein